MQERLQRFLNAELEALPSLMLTILATAMALWLVRRLARRVTSGTGFTRRRVRVETLRGVLTSALTVIIYVLSATAILATLGVNVTALLAGVSILGLAVSFGAQSLVKDVITGFFVLLEDQYGVGDVIRVNGAAELYGNVEGLNLRVTVLRDLEGTAHVIPNSEIKTVSVLSKDWARVVGDVDIPHDYHLEDAMLMLIGVATEIYEDPAWHDKFLEPPEMLGVQALGISTVTIRLLMKVQPKEQWGISREFKRRVKNNLEALGVRVPLPQVSLALPPQARVQVSEDDPDRDAPGETR
jgi:moderate conductance mechanosensitive channel